MVKPSASSSAITMFLPMSWMSPRTVAMTILPPPVSRRGAVEARDEELGGLAQDLAGHDERGDVVGALLVEAADPLHARPALLDEDGRVVAGGEALADLRERAALVHAHDELVEALVGRTAHGVTLLPCGRRCRRWW